MKKFIKLFFVFTLSLILLAGCSDFVDFNTSNINVGGRVVTENSNSAVADVVITDAKSGETVDTCSEGKWELTIVGRPEEAEIYAAKEGWEFSPEKQVVNSDNMGVIFKGTYAETEDQDTSDPSEPSDPTDDPVSFSISGDIVDEDDEPVNAVKLTLTDEDGEVAYDYSDRDGEFEFPNLKGEITITPEKDGYIFEPEYRKAEKDRDNIDFVAIKQFYDIEGIVTDKEGTPISNVKIKFNDDQYDSVITNINGEFTKRNLTGQVELEPIKDDYEFSPATINLKEANDNIEILAMRGSYDIEGLVLDEYDEPINGVDITFKDSNDQIIDTTVTGFEGQYSYSGLKGELRVIPEKDGYIFDPVERKTFGDSDEVNFRAEDQSYDISGIIVNENNGPISGVEIVINNREYDSVFTNNDGEFKSTNLIGDINIEPLKEDYTFKPDEINLDSAKDDIEIIGSRETYDISGTILDEDNEPVNGVDIVLRDENNEFINKVTTGFEGQYDYSGLEGETRAIPEKEGYKFIPDERKIIDGDSIADFEAIAKDYDIEGIVVDQDGEPVNGVEITLRDEDNIEIDKVTTGLEGQFSYSGLKGRVRVIPEKQGYTFDPDDRSIIDGDSIADFKAQRILYSVSGKVYSNEFDPIPNVKIHFYHKDSGDKIGHAITDENGEWFKDNLWGNVNIEPQGRPENNYNDNFDPETVSISDGSEEIDFIIYY